MAIFFHRGPLTALFKFSSISLPLFCFLLSWVSSTIPPPPSSSAIAAASVLRNRGYSLVAGIIDATADLDVWNGTGTILAPPDFAFSFSTARFIYGRAPRRPRTSLLLYHTLRQTLRLDDLTSRSDGEEIPTFFPRRCVFICKKPVGELCIAGEKNPVLYLRIRQPDLYVDENLIVHGVDGVLDLDSASKCTGSEASPRVDQTLPGFSSSMATTAVLDGSYLDHSVKVLRRKGYGVVATAMVIRRSDLTNVTALTFFAPSDENLFTLTNGFRYNFRYHVIPRRFRLIDLVMLPIGTEIETLVPGVKVVIGSVNGVVTVNGVMIYRLEVYQNRRIVIIAIPRPLEIKDAVNNRDFGQISGGLPDSDAVAVVPPAKVEDGHGHIKLAPTYVDHGAQSPNSDELFVDASSPATIRLDPINVNVVADSPHSSEFDVDVSAPTSIRLAPINDDHVAETPDSGKLVLDTSDPTSIGLAPINVDQVVANTPDSGERVVDASAPARLSDNVEEDLIGLSTHSLAPSTLALVPNEVRCSPAVSPVNFDGVVSALSVGLQDHSCDVKYNPDR